MSIHPAALRNPHGDIFSRRGRVLWQVNRSYAEVYDHLMRAGGLYEQLVGAGQMLPVRELGLKVARDPERAYRVLNLQTVPFESYPHEWGFGQTQAAALLMLDVQAAALQHGLVLRDASAYNVQFNGHTPLFNNPLAFDLYEEGRPWRAYRSFVRHFLSPLALMAATDPRLGQLRRAYIDGVPVSLAATLLPRRTLINIGLVNHIHLNKEERAPGGTDLPALVGSLRDAVSALDWHPEEAGRLDYYLGGDHDQAAFDKRQTLVRSYLGEAAPQTVLDARAGSGTLCELAAETGAQVLALDEDPGEVEWLFKKGDPKIIPLWVAMTNPTPALGWNNRELRPLSARVNADLVLAMALSHEMALRHAMPWPMIADGFSRWAPWLITEFIPPTDPMVIALLDHHQEVPGWYTQDAFEDAFRTRYTIVQAEPLSLHGRVLYLMQRHPEDVG